MANLSNVKTDSNWGKEAEVINRNFTAINTELSSLKNVAGIKMPLFGSTTEAKQAIPNPYYGQLVFIGNSLPAPVYKWNGSDFVSAGFTGGSASAPLSQYLTAQTVGTVDD